MKKYVVSISLILSMILFNYCKDESNPTEPTNQPPTITGLTATPDSLNPGESTMVSCLSNDPDNDVLDLSWSASAGTIIGTEATIEWIAPNFTGNQTITCSIDDNNGGNDNSSITINVFNSQPVISSLQSSIDTVKIGNTVQVNCIANDPDGDNLTYIWSSNDGTITGSGQSINWIAPLSIGSFSISCKIEDGNGGADSSEISIEVELLPISTQNLVGYWPIIGNSNDLSGNGNNGLVMGAQLTDDRIGNQNFAYDFDGIDDIIDIGNHSTLKPQLPITISLWIRPEIQGRNHILTTNYHNSNYYGVFMLVHNDGSIRTGFGDGGTIGAASNRGKYSTTTINANLWYHIVAIYKGPTDIDIYINGINDGGTYAGTGGAINYDNGSINLGRLDTAASNPPQYFNGILDEIIMFSRAISEQEVQKLYQVNW